MHLRSLLRGGLLLRTIAKELGGIRQQLARQADTLDRLADVVAPRPPRAAVTELPDTGVSFLDPLESALVQEYIARTTHDTGRAPTDEEVLTWLADEKTVDLHARLKARDHEIAQRTAHAHRQD